MRTLLVIVAVLFGCANVATATVQTSAPDASTPQQETSVEVEGDASTSPADVMISTDTATSTADAVADTSADVSVVDLAEISVTDVNQEDALEDAGVDVSVDTVPSEDLPLGQPIFTMHTSDPATLVVGENAVRYTIRSSGRPIAVKKLETWLIVHPFDEGSPTRSDWYWARRWQLNASMVRLFRDEVLVDRREYRAVPWQFTMTPFTNSLSIVFETEETIDRVGHTYAVMIPVVGTLTSGDAIEIAMDTGNDFFTNQRGTLTPNWSNFGPYHMSGPNIYTGPGRCAAETVVYDGYVRTSPFIWSDRSSPRHSYADCTTAEASDDWFNRAEVTTSFDFRLRAE